MGKGRNSLIGSIQAHLRRGAGNVVHGCRITGTYSTFSASVFFPGLSSGVVTSAGYDQAYIKSSLASAIGNGATSSNVTLTTFVNI